VIDPDDGVTVAQQRDHDPSRTAREVEHRAAMLAGQRLVEADVVAPPPVVVVVERGVLEVLDRSRRFVLSRDAHSRII
jgi:hypothetical protein